MLYKYQEKDQLFTDLMIRKSEEENYRMCDLIFNH